MLDQLRNLSEIHESHPHFEFVELAPLRTKRLALFEFDRWMEIGLLSEESGFGKFKIQIQLDFSN